MKPEQFKNLTGTTTERLKNLSYITLVQVGNYSFSIPLDMNPIINQLYSYLRHEIEGGLNGNLCDLDIVPKPQREDGIVLNIPLVEEDGIQELFYELEDNLSERNTILEKVIALAKEVGKDPEELIDYLKENL